MIQFKGEQLFSLDQISAFLAQRRFDLDHEVYELAPDDLLNTKLDDLRDWLVGRLRLEVPELAEHEVEEPQEAWVDVMRGRGEDWGRSGLDPNMPVTQRGTRQNVRINFTGDHRFFKVAPNQLLSTPKPRATIEGDRRRVTVTLLHFQASEQEVKSAFEQLVEDIQYYLGGLRQEVDNYHKTLPSVVETILKQRIDKVKGDRRTAQAIGLSIKRRATEPIGVILPKKPKKLKPAKPKPQTVLEEDEYYLKSDDYEDIIKTLQSMSLVFERSPAAFEYMEEEHIRFHFLVLLNGLYEGEATAETFNSSGKTDILINWHGRTIFIAECKFWDGPKELTKAIDQLFGYTTFRDTKVALLVFNRKVKFSTVLTGIGKTVAGHKYYEKTVRKTETVSRYIFRNPDDERKITLTVMAFNIPVRR